MKGKLFVLAEDNLTHLYGGSAIVVPTSDIIFAPAVSIPYTWNFSQYVNFTDFAVSRAALKIYSVKILPPRII